MSVPFDTLDEVRMAADVLNAWLDGQLTTEQVAIVLHSNHAIYHSLAVPELCEKLEAKRASIAAYLGRSAG